MSDRVKVSALEVLPLENSLQSMSLVVTTDPEAENWLGLSSDDRVSNLLPPQSISL